MPTLASVEIDTVASLDRWSTVIVTAHYEELPDISDWDEEVIDAYKLIRQRSLWAEPAYISAVHRAPSEGPTLVYYRIHIDTLTGRRAFPDVAEAAAAGYGS